jgi:hypothetical protein
VCPLNLWRNAGLKYRGEPRPPKAQAIRFLHKFAGSHFCHTASGRALKPSNLPSGYARHACKGRLPTIHSGAAVVLTRQCGGCSGKEAVGSSVLSVLVLGTGGPSSSVLECIGKAYKRSRSPLPNDVFEPRIHSETTRCPARHGKARGAVAISPRRLPREHPPGVMLRVGNADEIIAYPPHAAFSPYCAP